MSELSHQDWKPITLSKQTKAPAKVARPSNTLSKVQRQALTSDDPGKIETIDRAISQRIQQGRAAKKFSRKQLAQLISEKETLLADYENGKAIPNANIINKIEKVLGIKVRS